MATLTSYGSMTLAEVAKREHYDDAEAVLGELQQAIDLLQEIPWFTSTHGLVNKQAQATRLGSGAWGEVNAPVGTISSGTTVVDEPVKLYEGDSVIDERVFAGALDAYKVRDSEDTLNLEGLMQAWLSDLIYLDPGDNVNALRGFWSRRATLSSLTYPSRINCWGNSGTGSDLCSLMLAEFGKKGLYLAYPGNMKAGFLNEDRGRWRTTAPTGTGQFWAWIRHYEIWAALVLRNERALQRIANIENQGSSNIFTPSIFIKAKNNLPSMGTNAIAFGNRVLKSQIENDAYAKANAAYSISDIEGFGPVARVAGVPVRLCEALLETESQVS